MSAIEFASEPLHLQLFRTRRDWINTHVSNTASTSMVVCAHLNSACLATSWVTCTYLPTDTLEYSVFAIWVTNIECISSNLVHDLWHYKTEQNADIQIDKLMIEKSCVQMRINKEWKIFPRPTS